MNWLRSFILVVFTAAMLFLGVSLLMEYAAERGIIGTVFDYTGAAQRISASPLNWQLGLLFLIIGLAIIMLKVKEIRREQCIAFDNPEGEVAIAMDAVEEFIRRVGSEFEEVKSMIPSIHAGAEGIGIAVRMDVLSGANVPRLSEEMQHVIKEKVQDTLGINVNFVTVSVGKIVGTYVHGESVEEEEAE
jgi:uncharacterized alkaline shock family protein YloU